MLNDRFNFNTPSSFTTLQDNISRRLLVKLVPTCNQVYNHVVHYLVSNIKIAIWQLRYFCEQPRGISYVPTQGITTLHGSPLLIYLLNFMLENYNQMHRARYLKRHRLLFATLTRSEGSLASRFIQLRYDIDVIAHPSATTILGGKLC